MARDCCGAARAHAPDAGTERFTKISGLTFHFNQWSIFTHDFSHSKYLLCVSGLCVFECGVNVCSPTPNPGVGICILTGHECRRGCIAAAADAHLSARGRVARRVRVGRGGYSRRDSESGGARHASGSWRRGELEGRRTGWNARAACGGKWQNFFLDVCSFPCASVLFLQNTSAVRVSDSL